MNNSIKGEKHRCSNCDAKFFDLNKKPIICPKCNTEVLDKLNIRSKPVISVPKSDEPIVDNSTTEKLEVIEEDIGNDELEEDDDDTSTIVNID
jgi:uncharacterized protein (TIGR02300 family)